MPLVCQMSANILVGNGQYIGVLFVIPVTINLQEYRFEVYTLVSEINNNENIIMGIKMYMK